MRKLARNDLCWCGSGKKYKKCHLDSDSVSGVVQKEQIHVPPGVIIKTEKQIDGIRKSCKLTKEILDMVTGHIRAGITTDSINDLVHDYTIKHGATPAPLNYNGFPKSVCVSNNNVICHGIPDSTVLRDGDIVNVDVTTILDGYFGDAGRMFIIGNASEEARRLVKVARECLYIGIEQVKPYHDIGEIGYAIEQHAVKNGFSVVRDYGGHGIGIKFHEEPHVHHYGSRKRGFILQPGMVFTIEPMINQGRYETRLMADSWTAVTIDGKLSAQWEHTVLVTETGVEILTA
ncbi:MAG TPA: methionyl aminopeptidase [Spirochaetota bacterium]|nr:methionyl aminopeptidase [Spirochaetota bacterium]HPC39433.1 methionyl aminopeptidase [Spirochaetota bacterium]HQF06770.1 methionyl aminopeptidase [Spirochaetota bacterium]HQH95611.1 methionyl aminopeptidase [Spirochaetota bacterium]HQJ69189.1 methionyl aminopeptidase [Spirochaetota bacterium]